MNDVKKTVLKHALANAVEYNGKANVNAVLGKVLAEKPELKRELDLVRKEIDSIVKKINSWDLETQRKELKKFGFKKPVKKEKKGLPELPETKKVVMRIAPNPNGPLHIGHARMIILNDEYTKRYKGELILRFDDTDPKNPNKIPLKEAYQWIKNDLKWLGVKCSKIKKASSRLNIYYNYFKEFLKKGIAYVCTCKQKEWSVAVRRKRLRCPCRNNSIDENVSLWKDMLRYKFKEGEAVGRIKTPFTKDPAIIDWVAIRIVDKPKHPLVSKRFKLWPTLDFASAIDDHDFGITHIIRGKDLAISEKRQRILYDYLKWKYPVTKVFGRFKTTEDMVISKSKVSEGMKKGVYSGYDDPRLPFLVSFRKRGIQPEAIRNYIINLGLTEVDTTVDLDILYSENRKIIDPIAKRHFIVVEPEQILLDRIPVKTIKAPLFPGKRKYRKIPTSKKIFVEKQDFVQYHGKEIRLMHFCNIHLDKNARVTSVKNKDIPKIHWVGTKNVKIKLIMSDASELGCLAEPDVKKVKPGEIVQFERIGFARCEKKGLFYFAHR